MYIYEVIIFSLSVLILSLGLLFFLYTRNRLHTYKPLLIFIQTTAGIFSIIFSSAVVIQVLNYNRQRQVEIVKDYEDLAKSFYNDIIQVFINNNDMQYYFENLFNNKPIPYGTVRNITKEREITYLIFSKLGTITSYETIMNKDDKKFLDQWIVKILGNYMESDVFRGYWNDYKDRFGGYLSSIYMKEHFNV